MSSSAGFAYPGGELELFAGARNWKRYLRRRIGPSVRGRVLEVGAGIGATTRALWDEGVEGWVLLEPDPRMVEGLRRAVDDGGLPARCRVVEGTLDAVGDERFDCILYVDVLEHIERDREELERASARLAPGGRVVVLSPAHGWLFTDFDRALGHHRRYDLRALRTMTPPTLRVVQAEYLDAVGILASLGNRLLLRSAQPTPGQIRVWDRAMVPVSRILDPLLGRRLGKSVLVAWELAPT